VEQGWHLGQVGNEAAIRLHIGVSNTEILTSARICWPTLIDQEVNHSF